MCHPPLRITQRSKLPHWEMDGSVYFITFNTWKRLTLNAVAQQIIFDSYLFFNLQRYQLSACVVMPDHVHLLMRPSLREDGSYWRLATILHSLKSYTAKQVPTVMPHISRLWQSERYDRIVRDAEEFERTWHYICQNPVKARLCQRPRDYPFLWHS